MPPHAIYWNPAEREALEHAWKYSSLCGTECKTEPNPCSAFFASLYASTAAHIAFAARPSLREVA